MEKRKVITRGYRWIRFILIPIVIALIAEVVSISENRAKNIVFIFACICLYYLFAQLRRLQHDNNNFYIINGSKEKTIPMSNIISIKKSKTTTNWGRFWILRYSDDSKKERYCRFFSDFNKEFHSLVREANPDVVIWTHPHFNH